MYVVLFIIRQETKILNITI